MELILSVIVITLITLSINFFLYRRKKKHLLLIDSLFEAFNQASRRQNISEIDRLGKEIIYNDCLTKVHLDSISETVDLHLDLHPNLLVLKELIMNKQLLWVGMSSF